MVAGPTELRDGFLAGGYLLELNDHSYVANIKGLGLVNQHFWNDGLIDELRDQRLILPSDDSYFLDSSVVHLTDEGRTQAIDLICTPGARVPESVLMEWKRQYTTEVDESTLSIDDEVITEIPLPQRIMDRIDQLKPYYDKPYPARPEPDSRSATSAFEEHESSKPHDTTELSHITSGFTGLTNERERIQAIKLLIGPSLTSIDALIADLDHRHNGGPELDDGKEKVELLRSLHSALGELLDRADRGHLGSDLSAGLVAEIYGLCRRLKKAFMSDPLPLSIVLTIAGIGSLLGAPTMVLAAASGLLMKVARTD